MRYLELSGWQGGETWTFDNNFFIMIKIEILQ